jgi:hypothetical protein
MFLFMLGIDIRIGVLWPAFYRKLIGVDDLTDVKQRNSRLRRDLDMRAIKTIK